MTNAPYSVLEKLPPAGRVAALAGTREMIRDDEFSTLVAVLVDCGAVPRNVMAAVLDGLAKSMIAKARGELESDALIYPTDLFDRARSLQQMAEATASGMRR